MDNQQATRVSLSWFTGFMEGEGCFTPKRLRQDTKTSKWRDCRVTISNQEIDLVTLCVEFLRTNLIPSYITTARKGRKKPLYEVCISGTQNCRLLHQLVKDKMQCRTNELEEILGASTNRRETTIDFEWLIGFYEAEGCFNIDRGRSMRGRPSYKPSVVLVNTNFTATEKVAKTLYSLGLSWYTYNGISNIEGRKPYKSLRIEGYKRVCRFLVATKSKWIGNRTNRRIELLQEFCNSRLNKDYGTSYTEREHQIVYEIKM